MELELSRSFDATADQLWSILLNPERMARCVPGMKSVEVLSDTEYRARIQVKIAFISAKFDVRTVITEMTAPSYLRCETTGEDNSVGSSVKSVSEMFLTPTDGGGTELRVTAKATVLGRLGTLGLNPMRTKAERMWEQFCESLQAELDGTGAAEPEQAPPAIAATPNAAPVETAPQPEPAVPTAQEMPEGGFWAGLCRRFNGSDTIRVELDRDNTRVVLHWPSNRADQCLAWLDRQLDRGGPA